MTTNNITPINTVLDRASVTALKPQPMRYSEPTRAKCLKETLLSLTNMRLLTDPSPQVYQTWTDGLADLPEAAIRFGLERARDFTGFFTLPAFRELCKVSPQVLGLASAKHAYMEACNKDLPWERQTWSHPAVYYAARETGRFELHSFTEREAFPLFKANYEIMCSRVLNGEQLTMPLNRMLPESVPNPTSPEVAKTRLAAIRELIP